MTDDASNAVGDVLHVWSAPLRLDAEGLVPLFLIGESVLLVALHDGAIQEWIREHPRSAVVRALGPVRESKPLSKLGYTHVLLPLSATLYAGGWLLDSRDLREAGLGCATADVANTLARHLIARLVGRLRPRYGEGPYRIELLAWGDWPMRSFPGGHGANIAACTTFWNRRFDLGAAEPALYSLAAAIGLARVVDEAHWASDALFGAIFGWAVGSAVADRFLDRDDGGTREAPAGAAAPPLSIGWRIRF